MRLAVALSLPVFACQPVDNTEPLASGVEVVIVDPAGDELPVSRVAWFDAAAVPFILGEDATPIECPDGAESCARRQLDGSLPERFHIVTSIVQPDRSPPTGEGDVTCGWWDSQFTVVHRDDSGQRVFITLDPEAYVCDDGIGVTFTPAYAPPTVHPDDVRAEREVPLGRIVVRAEDAAGRALPMTKAHWYFPPEGPDYDGEHPLVCADALCATYTLPDGEGPVDAQIFINGTYDGPYHPWGDVHLGDYGGSPVTLGADEPIEVTLTLDTSIASVM